MTSGAAISLPSCLRGTKVDPNDRDTLDAEKIRLSTRSKGRPRPREADLPPPSGTQRPRPRPSRNTPEKYTNISAILSGPSDAIPTLGDYDALKAGSKSSPDTLSSTTRPTPPTRSSLLRRRTRRSDRLGSESVSIAGVKWGRNLEGAREGGFSDSEPRTPPLPAFVIAREAVANQGPGYRRPMAVDNGRLSVLRSNPGSRAPPSQAAADDTATEVLQLPDRTARTPRT